MDRAETLPGSANCSGSLVILKTLSFQGWEEIQVAKPRIDSLPDHGDYGRRIGKYQGVFAQRMAFALATPVTREIDRELVPCMARSRYNSRQINWRPVFHNMSNRLGAEIRNQHISAGIRAQELLSRVVQPRCTNIFPSIALWWTSENHQDLQGQAAEFANSGLRPERNGEVGPIG